MTRRLRASPGTELPGRAGAAARWGVGPLAATMLVLLGACAPDAFRRDPEFEAWIRDVRTACYRERIGPVTVGDLIGASGSREGAHFFNQTSRLYAGLLTPAQWTSNVTAFVSGRASDPGVKCVLDRLPKK